MRLKTVGRLVSEAGGLMARAYGAWQGHRRSGAYSFKDRVVFITGGSRGLGLVLARQLVAEGARVALLARDEAELERAAADLRARGGSVLTLPGDVTSREAIESAVARAAAHFGRLDVLINNAGIIQTGPFEHMNLRDFEQALGVHFFGPLYATLAALPHLKKRAGARIVNIASIGGKLPVPHLLPYCASKFALVGFSSGLRTELARHRIPVTTVCPGLMRTGSHLNAQFKGKQAKEYFWFALSASLPLTAIPAESAAAQILTACRRGDAELVIGWTYRMAARLAPLVPGVVARGLALFNRLMPGPTGPEGDRLLPGWASTELTPSLLTILGDRAARANNELPQPV
jgi:NAD(P)-dependent dehydrogenase (short-subunit alcohol dehydrogenase family)